MKTIGIMANGPSAYLPDLSLYKAEIDEWIGADRGALTLLENHIPVDYAVGDFDSVDAAEQEMIQKQVRYYKKYPIEKDKTDLEIALLQAFERNPSKIFLFGVTGGRFDHTLVNIQILLSIVRKNMKGIIIDQHNKIELTLPGEHVIERDDHYPNVSFIPFTPVVKGLTLKDFYYPLTNVEITMGSTRCISNKLLSNNGTFLYKEGILLLIKSRDVNAETISM